MLTLSTIAVSAVGMTTDRHHTTCKCIQLCIAHSGMAPYIVQGHQLCIVHCGKVHCGKVHCAIVHAGERMGKKHRTTGDLAEAHTLVKSSMEACILVNSSMNLFGAAMRNSQPA